MLMNRKTVSIARACGLAGVCRRTIYYWIAGGKVQYIRTAGGSVRIFEDTLWRSPDPTHGETHNIGEQRLSRSA
jgi:excisionase family DNA binding protein